MSENGESDGAGVTQPTMGAASEKKAKKPGRPTKRDAARVARLLKALRDGNTRKASCLAAGISEDSLARWLEGSADFADQVARAEAEAELGHVATIKKAASERKVVITKVKENQVKNEDGQTITVTETTTTTKKEFDWKASAWWLARRRRSEWGEARGGGHGGSGGGDEEGDNIADMLFEIAGRVAVRPVPQPENADNSS